ncbi:DUF420 domain-containing protein [Sutcliffiella cohnii]|uniref:DUF420 domain-containing protein n=1 Tax=Sutcliffiella cohnii TaxID=33932 RepID=A0A223KWJ9_9BACI|nr:MULTISPECIES: DUF420 domain-containing protein [Sutcliffiella]AST93822.1 hypothetical protein BC6307_22365 [Sutcliffiella cohnii]MED4015847.1 DUF420 domain-containing protein [Sutcliffiella cohnii]WBL15013.1 DUF420 domain-containing protein [Sutcliffiella sp. NC1]
MQKKKIWPWVIGLSIAINALVVILFFLPEQEQFANRDLTVLPMMNAIFNSFTFLFLIGALVAIKNKNITIHRRFIYAAFTTTALFLVTYVTYHALTESTPFGGEGIIRSIYFFILLTHIVLAAIIVPLALFSFAYGITMQKEKHRKISRWTMPIWLYVSLTGVLVYLMISPYY